MERRSFLRAFSILAVGFMFGSRELSNSSEMNISFDEALHFTLRLSSIYEKLPPYHVPMDEKHLREYVNKIVPAFRECGFVDSDTHPTSAKLSDMLDERADGDQTIAGVTDCDYTGVTFVDGMSIGKPTKSIRVNSNLDNSDSWWFQLKAGLIWTTHELAHVAQEKICFATHFSIPGFERDAQLVTAEVLAYLGNKGWTLAQYSFVTHLMYMSMDAVRYLAMSDEKYMPICNFLENYVYKSNDDRAIYNIKKDALPETFRKYGYEPLNKLLTSHTTAANAVKGLTFDHECVTLKNVGKFLRENALA